MLVVQTSYFVQINRFQQNKKFDSETTGGGTTNGNTQVVVSGRRNGGGGGDNPLWVRLVRLVSRRLNLALIAVMSAATVVALVEGIVNGDGYKW